MIRRMLVFSLNKLNKSMYVEKACKKHGLAEHKVLVRKGSPKPTTRCIRCYKEDMLKKVSTDRIRTKANKLVFIERLGGKCMECGEVFSEWAMDFHHRDRLDKNYKVSSLLRLEITETIIKEVDKYDLLCSCCHRKRHHKEDHKSGNPVNTYTKMIKSLIVKAFGSKCQLCNIEDHYIIYDFHHINPEHKTGQLSDMVKFHMSLDIIAEEAKKCIMLCACCHMSVHATGMQLEEKEYFNYQVIADYKESRLKKYSHCKTCNKEITYGASYCLEHYTPKKTIKRPSLEELTTFLISGSYLAAGRKYGVSDNTIRKWTKTLTR